MVTSLQTDKILLVLFHLVRCAACCLISIIGTLRMRRGGLWRLLAHVGSVIGFQTHLWTANLEVTSSWSCCPMVITDLCSVSGDSFRGRPLVRRLLHTILHGDQMTHLLCSLVMIVTR